MEPDILKLLNGSLEGYAEHGETVNLQILQVFALASIANSLQRLVDIVDKEEL
jgi:hypothetical protein